MSKEKLSDAEKALQIERTRDAALVLADDLQHIRDIASRPLPSPGDLRRMSSLLRRILVEGDLRKVANPRVGKVVIKAPDYRVLHRANENRPFLLVSADHFETDGITYMELILEEDEVGENPRYLPHYDSSDLIDLFVEPFQNQKVICYRGKWVTRAQVIKYVANVGHGVHTGDARDAYELLIRKVRQSVFITKQQLVPNGPEAQLVHCNFDALAAEDPPIEFRPDRLDLALLHLLSTAQLLTSSPDVIELERVIMEVG